MQEGLSKEGLIALYERERDSIAEALSSSIIAKREKNSDSHLMQITNFALKSGAEVGAGVVGDDRAGVVIYFRTPK